MALAMIPVALAAASAVAGVAGTVVSSVAQNNSAKYNQQVQENNAAYARQNAIAAQQQADQDAERVRKKGLLLNGTLLANAGRNGVALDSGSVQDVGFSNLVNTEQDALDTKYQGQMRARGYEIQANNYDDAATLAGSQKSDLLLSAGGALLSGAASTYSTYDKFAGSGVIPSWTSDGWGPNGYTYKGTTYQF
jgi:hypothetical protein